MWRKRRSKTAKVSSAGRRDQCDTNVCAVQKRKSMKLHHFEGELQSHLPLNGQEMVAKHLLEFSIFDIQGRKIAATVVRPRFFAEFLGGPISRSVEVVQGRR